MSNRITPLILAVALFMELMDVTVISTALPAIAADIGTDPISLKLALASYLVALAVFIPISGWMADRYGARNVFRAAIGVFMIGSLACAFADSLFSFVVARFVQGMGGSMMTPLSRLILVRNTPKKDLVNAWAWLTLPALFGPLAGPPVGGFLTTYFSWHWIFYINIPIGVIGILLATKYLGGTGYRERRPLDVSGFLLSGLCFSGLIFGLSVISLPALPPIVGGATTVAGLVCGWLYILHFRRVKDPVLDLKVFEEPVFKTSIIAGFIYRVAGGAVPFLFPLMLQVGFGYSPFESGMISFIGAGGAILMKFCLKPALAMFGFRVIECHGCTKLQAEKDALEAEKTILQNEKKELQQQLLAIQDKLHDLTLAKEASRSAIKTGLFTEQQVSWLEVHFNSFGTCLFAFLLYILVLSHVCNRNNC